MLTVTRDKMLWRAMFIHVQKGNCALKKAESIFEKKKKKIDTLYQSRWSLTWNQIHSFIKWGFKRGVLKIIKIISKSASMYKLSDFES